MRVQNPMLQRTRTADPATSRWYIRPYVPQLRDGRFTQAKERIYLGLVSEMDEREAGKARNRELERLNRRQLAPQVTDRFGDFMDEYQRDFMTAGNLAFSTRQKYESILKLHIRPAFAGLPMCDVTTKRIDLWLEEKAKSGMSWARRMDLRNLVSGLFTVAERWGRWTAKNPARNAIVGRKRAVREKRKLTVEQIRSLLAALPLDVRVLVSVALFCTLRISEVLGLMWKHIDWDRGVISVRQRFFRGDLDVVKSDRSAREVPMGYLIDDLRPWYPGPHAAEDYVFRVKTKSGFSRDDRHINQHFLSKAAKRLGIYWVGFGFHAFRREAITAIAAACDPIQAMRAAGHSSMDTTLLYGLQDLVRQDAAIRRTQELLLGTGSPQ